MKAPILNFLYVLLISFLVFYMTMNSVFAGEDSGNVFKGEKITIRVDGLTCPFCAYGLEKKLESMEGVDTIEIKVNEGMVFLSLKKSAEITEAVLRKKVKEAGFTPREITAVKSGEEADSTAHKVTLKIEGMQCENYVSRVQEALNGVCCAKDIEVSLEKNQATLTCVGDEKQLVGAVGKAGFKAEIINESPE